VREHVVAVGRELAGGARHLVGSAEFLEECRGLVRSLGNRTAGPRPFRGEASADVSHELMTPLTGMRGYLETLSLHAESLDAETRERLAELTQLERAIGKAGVLALRPLMMATGKEIWQLTLLRP